MRSLHSFITYAGNHSFPHEDLNMYTALKTTGLYQHLKIPNQYDYIQKRGEK